VRSLPGKPGRRYVIALLSNLGYRYSDAPFASARELPCFGLAFCYTEKIAQLGKRVDDLLRGRPLLVEEAGAGWGGELARRAGAARRRALGHTGG